jgi:hypothetical protein
MDQDLVNLLDRIGLHISAPEAKKALETYFDRTLYFSAEWGFIEDRMIRLPKKGTRTIYVL